MKLELNAATVLAIKETKAELLDSIRRDPDTTSFLCHAVENAAYKIDQDAKPRAYADLFSFIQAGIKRHQVFGSWFTDSGGFDVQPEDYSLTLQWGRECWLDRLIYFAEQGFTHVEDNGERAVLYTDIDETVIF